MLTKVKRNFVRIIAIIIIPILAYLCVYCSIHISFVNTSKWKYKVDDFDTFQEDFQTVADFCLHKVKEIPEIAYFTLTKNDIIYVVKNVDGVVGGYEMYASNDIINSFCNIELAFPDSDAKLDVIYCVDDAVYFTTHNGLYSVVFSPNTKPTTMSGVNINIKANTKIITDNWYHAVKK